MGYGANDFSPCWGNSMKFLADKVLAFPASTKHIRYDIWDIAFLTQRGAPKLRPCREEDGDYGTKENYEELLQNAIVALPRSFNLSAS